MRQQYALATVKLLMLIGNAEVLEIVRRKRILLAEDDCCISNVNICEHLQRRDWTLTLVHSVPIINSISKPRVRKSSILDEVSDNVLAQPASIGVLEHERGVPMISS